MSRIEQFRKMANDDPGNPLGHFSLGGEYLRSDLFAEAEQSLSRALEIDPKISKAYELLAQALLRQGKRDRAVDVLTRGAKLADERGDLMPRNSMVRMLGELGAPAPTFADRGPAAAVGEGQIQCARCGQIKPKLPKPPFSNEMGREIYEKVCAECWRLWIPMGTKVINELRLPLHEPEAQKVYDQHMMEFLNLR